jgi:phosphate starvation-inducible PhoH-like protein
VLGDIDDIHFSRLTSADVVRHSLVGQIVDAYTKYDAERQAARFEREQGRGASSPGNPDGVNRADRRGHAAPQDRRPPSATPDRRWGR